ncbi:MAG: flagellar biosynthesis protein FlhF [bacterium]
MMKYKTYVAETLPQAILKMTLDLGKDAIMINHRNTRQGGVLGLFSKPMVEVTAALPTARSSPGVKPSSLATNRSRPGINHSSEEQAVPLPPTSLSAVDEKPPLTKVYSPPKSVIKPVDERVEFNLIHQEMRELKSKIDLLVSSQRPGNGHNFYPGRSEEFYRCMIGNGMESELSERLIKDLISDNPSLNLEDREELRKGLAARLERLIEIDADSWEVEEGTPKTLVLVGPTGVGKTTTVAKLAADFAFHKQLKVALITIDTYRIAAVEQLKAFAEILGVPLKVVFTQNEFSEAIESFSDCDLVLIDTAGRSQRNTIQMTELKNFITAAGHKLETYLLLSATTKYKDLLNIIDNFQKVSFDRIIFTKLDETVTFGSMISLLAEVKKPLSYVTTGQNVPEDIEVADAAKLANMVLQ